MAAIRAIRATVGDDVREAVRHLVRSPFRTVAIVAILAIGIGLNTGLFAVVHSLGTRPATGIPTNERLVRIRGSVRNVELGRSFDRALSLAEVDALATHTDVFEAVAAWTTHDAIVTRREGDAPVLATAAFVTPGYFAVLGVRPALGRNLGPTDTGVGSAVPAVIAHDLWTTLFGEAPDALGRTLDVDGASVTVVGVAPPGFRGPNERDRPRVVWLPLRARASVEGADPGALESAADSLPFSVVARLSSGTTAARASVVAATVARRTAREATGDRFRDPTAEVVPLLAYNDQALEGLGRGLAALSALAAIVLLIVGANVAVLLAGAAVARRREMAVRLSLGAARTRVARQLVIESVLLAIAGGALGVTLLVGVVGAADSRLVRETLVIDWTAVLACLAVSAVVGVGSGLLPALHATRGSLSESLRGSGGSSGVSRLFLQRRLVVLQVAVTQPLLLGVAALSAVLVEGARGSARSPVGAQVLVVDANRVGASVDAEQMGAGVERFVRRVRELPEVTDVVSQHGGFSPGRYAVPAEDRPGSDASFQMRARDVTAAPGYFDLMEMRFERGRAFEDTDADAVIVGSDLAHEIWGSADPIGRRLYRGSGDSQRAVTVVGVVEASAARRGAGGPGWVVWVPPSPTEPSVGIFHTFYVRTRGPAVGLVPTVGVLLREEVPALAIEGIATLADKERAARRWLLIVASVATVGGLLALLLASVGLYASAALAVRQRTREVGIRMALGARGSSVEWLFLRSGVRLSLIGLGLGLPLSVVAFRWLAAELQLPSLLLGSLVAGSVLAVTSLATWMPARRAAAVDPNVTLRAD